MLVSRAFHLTLLTAAVLWGSPTDGATTALKLCGRKLGEFMSRVCQAYNSPSWDVPIVVEQPAARRKRHVGIADECCTEGCTWEQISAYCAVSAYPESPLEALETHMIEDRSAEHTEGSAPAVAARPTSSPGRENLLRNAVRGAPVVGTVSPLLTWGRTLNTDLPPAERDRYAYIAVYT